MLRQYNEQSDYVGYNLPPTHQAQRVKNNNNKQKFTTGYMTKPDRESCCSAMCSIVAEQCCSVIRTALVISFFAALWHSGYRHDYLIYLALYELLSCLCSLLMAAGVKYKQPFLCVPAVAMRVMEMILWGCVVAFFAHATCKPNDEPASTLRQFVRMAFRELEAVDRRFKTNINLDDFANTLAPVLFLVTLFCFALSLSSARVGWVTAIKTADARRKERTEDRGLYGVVTRQPLVPTVPDELYMNYN